MIKTEACVQIEGGAAKFLNDGLLQNHSPAQSVWLVAFKQHGAGRYVPSQDVLDALIAFG